MGYTKAVNDYEPSPVRHVQFSSHSILNEKEDIEANRRSTAGQDCSPDYDRPKEVLDTAEDFEGSSSMLKSQVQAERYDGVPVHEILVEDTATDAATDVPTDVATDAAPKVVTDAATDSKADDQKSPLGEDFEDIPATKIVRLDEMYDLTENRTKLTKTFVPPPKKRASSAALYVRRVMDFYGEYKWTKIDIKSEALLEVLLEINKDVKDLEIRMKPPVAEPELFFYSLQSLKQRLKAENQKAPRNKALIADLKAAIAFAEDYHKDTITTVRSLSGMKEISWDLLWTIFRPNTMVYFEECETGTDQIMKLLHCKRSTRKPHSRPEEDRDSWLLTCQYFAVTSNDGTSPGESTVAGYCTHKVQIDEYPGVMEIADLEVYPLQYKRNKVELEKRLISRGKKAATMTGIKYCQVQEATTRTTPSNVRADSRTIKENVMIDSAGFAEYNPDSKLIPRIKQQVQLNAMTDEDYLICSPLALGYSFKTKAWFGFDVSQIVPVIFKENTLDAVVIDPRRKVVIKSLFNQHSRLAGYDDIIEGKGQGLIGLFAGGPGCGKTLTVEAVAEETKKPLYMVSAGELGIEPEDVEEHLCRILALSYRWDAVLLLDEADVFLQCRNKRDVRRNAMVSIFLRQLEYFKGIMILTTNRVENCDPAFESRIHFSMLFPELDFEARKLIWEMFLRKAFLTERQENGGDESMSMIPAVSEVANARQSHSILEDKSYLDMLAAYPLNGRQIQNAVRTANVLAREDGEQLKMSHLAIVLGVGSVWTSSRPRVEESRAMKELKRVELTRVDRQSYWRWLINFAVGFGRIR